ncbi:MAG: hypothetical protein JXO22_13705, partial [Phycisphaerae bacterium]|nr:hypothetical protein [Phycisphaerae bacterium]
GGICGGTVTRVYRVTDDCGNYAECTQVITVDDTTNPVITCPPDVLNVYADAGTCCAVIDPVAATATDNCDTSVTIAWVRSDSKTSLSDPFCAGESPITITWTAEDDCGNTDVCDQTITVLDVSEIDVTVELSPTISPLPVTRCITFELWDCGMSSPVVVQEALTFQNIGGAAIATATVEVPCGLYECITARDILHTLRTTDQDNFGILGTQYVADFTGGDMLIGGNLNDDFWIDILDFGVFSSQWNVSYGSGNTTCTTGFPHADISGDGLVWTGDFTFIQNNFLLGNEANCCGQPNLFRDQGPITEISVADLVAAGMAELAAGDLNGDGWLDEADVSAFLMGARPQTAPIHDIAPIEREARRASEVSDPTPVKP